FVLADRAPRDHARLLLPARRSVVPGRGRRGTAGDGGLWPRGCGRARRLTLDRGRLAAGRLGRRGGRRGMRPGRAPARAMPAWVSAGRFGAGGTGPRRTTGRRRRQAVNACSSGPHQDRGYRRRRTTGQEETRQKAGGFTARAEPVRRATGMRRLPAWRPREWS